MKRSRKRKHRHERRCLLRRGIRLEKLEPRWNPSGIYPNAVFVPAAAENFSAEVRQLEDVNVAIVHTTEASCESTINHFQNPDSDVSAHFVLCQDSRVVQMVSTENPAWHAGNLAYNNAGIGIELERSGEQQITESQYRELQQLVTWIEDTTGVPLEFPTGLAPPDPGSFAGGLIGHNQVPHPDDLTRGGGISGHTDPLNFDWGHFESLFAMPELSIGDATVSEGGTAELTISLSEPAPQLIALNVQVTDVTAVATEDYEPIGGAVFIAHGATSATISIDTIDNRIAESTESFQVDVQGDAGDVQLVDPTAVVTILDNDGPSTIWVANNPTVTEGETAEVDVKINPVSDGPIEFYVETISGTAISGLDFDPHDGTIVLPAGSPGTTISVAILEDDQIEGAEQFVVGLSDVDGAQLGRDSANIGIRDNDVLPETGRIEGMVFHDANRNEQQDPGEPGIPGVRLWLDADANGLLDQDEQITTTGSTGHYAFTNVPAGHWLVSQVVPNGQTPVSPPGSGKLYFAEDRNPDGLYEVSTEDASVTHVGETGAVDSNIGLAPTGDSNKLIVSTPWTLNEVRTDGSPAVYRGDLVVSGLAYNAAGDTWFGSGGSTFAEIDVGTARIVEHLPAPPNTAQGLAAGDGSIFAVGSGGMLARFDLETQSWSHIGLTGIFGNDYGAAYDPFSQRLFVKAGEDPVLYAVDPTTADATPIGDTGIINGGGLAYQIVGPPTHEVTIGAGQTAPSVNFANDATLPSIIIDDVIVPEGDVGTTSVEVVVRLSSPAPVPIPLTYQTAGGTATSMEDYKPVIETFVVEPGVSEMSFFIDVVGDTHPEPDESFSVVVHAAGDEQEAQVTILNDDPVYTVGVTLQAVDPATGQRINSVMAGTDFNVVATVEDLRDLPQGVFAAALDVEYSAGVDIVGMVFGDEFPNGQTWTDTGSEIQDLSAMAGLDETGEEDILAILSARATTAGGVAFLATPPESSPSPLAQTLVFGEDEPVSEDMIAFGALSIEVVPSCVATPDEFTGDEDSPLMLDVLANDVGSGPLHIVTVGTSQHGAQIRIEGDQIVYDPTEALQSLRPGESVTDQFAYTIGDDHDNHSSSIVTVVIEGRNDAPVAVDDLLQLAGGAPATIAVRSNDHDPDHQYTELAVEIVIGPNHGTAETQPDGSVVYMPLDGFVGADSFTYRLMDPAGAWSEATVELDVRSPWQNPLNRLDVDNSGSVSSLDALFLISEINSGGARRLPASRPEGAKYLDPSGDTYVAALDVLMIINGLNAPPSGEGEQSEPLWGIVSDAEVAASPVMRPLATEETPTTSAGDEWSAPVSPYYS